MYSSKITIASCRETSLDVYSMNVWANLHAAVMMIHSKNPMWESQDSTYVINHWSNDWVTHSRIRFDIWTMICTALLKSILAFFVSGSTRDFHGHAAPVCALDTDLVDKVLPVLDEHHLVLVTVLVLCESKHRARSPQIQLSQCLTDCYLTLGSLVQLLQFKFKLFIVEWSTGPVSI